MKYTFIILFVSLSTSLMAQGTFYTPHGPAWVEEQMKLMKGLKKGSSAYTANKTDTILLDSAYY